MLREIQFQNFKSWKQAKIECAPITGFFGRNSSGKSGIFHFLLLLKQTAESFDRSAPLKLDEPLIDLGGPANFMHEDRSDEVFSWRLAMEIDSHPFLELPDLADIKTGKRNGAKTDASGALVIDNEVRNFDGVLLGSKLGYSLGSRKFELRLKNSDTIKIKESIRSEGVEEFRNWLKFEFRCLEKGELAPDSEFEGSSERPPSFSGPVKSYAFPPEIRERIRNVEFLADMESAYERQMNKLFYLGPLRTLPQRGHVLTSHVRFGLSSGVGRSGELAIQAIADATLEGRKARIPGESKQVDFHEMISFWLQRMGLIHDFRLKPANGNNDAWEALVTQNRGAREIHLADAGFGVSQALPVITLLGYVPRGSTVMLEHPELGLHALAQAELADAIIRAVRERDIQVLIESHSEHLLLRLQRRMAEADLSNQSTALYNVSMLDNESKLDLLDINEVGEISNWPPKFMGDALNETIVAHRARMQRDSGGNRIPLTA